MWGGGTVRDGYKKHAQFATSFTCYMMVGLLLITTDVFTILSS